MNQFYLIQDKHMKKMEFINKLLKMDVLTQLQELK